MTLSKKDAGILLKILDESTSSNWPDISYALSEEGYTPAEIVAAWKSLEKIAGCKGTAPDIRDS